MIAYNLPPSAPNKMTGIGFYSYNVMRALMDIRKEPCEAHVFDFLNRYNVDPTVNKYLGDIPGCEVHKVKHMHLGIYTRIGSLGRLYPYKLLTHSKADLTVFFNYLAPQGLKGKRIVTIYDMVCMRYPETMDDKNRQLLCKHLPRSAAKADAVLTISEFSKKEIMNLLGVPEEKIYVAPCGVDTDFYSLSDDISKDREAVRKEYGTDNYIFYVGTLEPRKNTTTLIKAFEKAAADMPDTTLILSGGVGWHSEDILNHIENSPVKDRIIRTGYISNEMKRSLLRCAKVMVFPSLYEGYGMPVTEAMACGTPCIVSDTSSLPEVSGGLNSICPCLDVDAFAETILKYVNGEIQADPQQLVTHARKNTWESAAQVLNDAITSLV